MLSPGSTGLPQSTATTTDEVFSPAITDKRSRTKCTLCGGKANDHQQLQCGCMYHLECVSELFQVDAPQCMCGFNLGSSPAVLAVSSVYLEPTENNRFSSFIHLPAREELLEAFEDSLLESAADVGQVYSPKVDIFEYTAADSDTTELVVSVKAPQVYDLIVQQNESSSNEFTKRLSNAVRRSSPLGPAYKQSDDLKELATYFSLAVLEDAILVELLIECGLGITQSKGKPSPDFPAQLVEREVAAFPNWNMLVKPPVQLLCYDYMDVLTTLGSQFDPVVAYLFTNCIVFVHNRQVIGQVLVNDIAAVAACGQQVVVSLTTSHLPELIFELHPVAVVKWDILLKRVVATAAATIHANLVHGEDVACTEVDPLPLKQLTTNAWDYHPRVFDQWASPELEEFAEQVVSKQAMRPEVLVEAVPAPDPVLLNLVLCLCVENHSSMSNQEYGEHLTRLIHQLLQKLRSHDTLALVFVGGGNLLFIGLAPALWDGWALIIDDLEIVGDAGLADHVEEYTAVFDKLHSLYPFIPDKVNRTNKVLVVSSNVYDDDTVSVIGDGLRRKIVALERLSISLVRVGAHVAALTALVQALQQPIEFMDSVKVTYGQHLVRFDDFDAFDYELRHLIERYQRVVVPMVTVSFEPSTLTQITSIEVAGGLQLTNGALVVSVVVKDILPGHERNIMLEVNSTTDDIAPRLAYKVDWGRGNDVKAFHSRGVDNRQREFMKRLAEILVLYWMKQVISATDSVVRHETTRLAVSQLYHLICNQWGYLRVSEYDDDEYIELASVLSLASLANQTSLATLALDEYFGGLLRELKLIAAAYSHRDTRRADSKSCDVAFSLM